MIFFNKQAVLFDLDGTVIDSQAGIRNSLIYAFGHLGMPIPPEEVLHQFFGPSLAFTFRRLFRFSEAECDRAVSLYREYYNAGGLFECTPYPGIPELLQALHANGRRVILATKKPEQMAVRILEGLGLSPFFHEICGSSPEDKTEHKGHILTAALERAGISDRSTAVMVGDMSYDCIAAREAGIDCIGVLYGYGDEKNLSECPPQAIAHDADELAALLLP